MASFTAKNQSLYRVIHAAELYYILESNNVNAHYYADDTQILIEIGGADETQAIINDIIGKISTWMRGRKLKLNVEKTESIIIKSNALNNDSQFNTVNIDGNSIQIKDSGRSLGVIFDSNLDMKTQLNQAKKKAVYNLINIRRIAKFINEKARIKLVHCMVFSQLDYCNALYYGLPNRDIKPLQIILNNSSRMIKGMARYSRERITPVNISLHFLPIKARIIYKLCLLVYKGIHHENPAYISELLKSYEPQRSLRTSERLLLQEPVVAAAAYSNRCFRYCAPRVHSKLPLEVRSSHSLAIFKNKLKTELFQRAYDLDELTIRSEFDI